MSSKFVLAIAIATLCFPANAYAYIDPGTGSLVLQAVIAGGVTALVFIRRVRDKIFSLFRRGKK